MISRTDVELLAEGVAVGDKSGHLVCPVCGGGPSHEASFMVWRDGDGVAYKCYRVKCGVGGKYYSDRQLPSSKQQRKPKSSTASLIYNKIPFHVEKWLLSRFPWLSHDLLWANELRWEPTKEGVLLPIRYMQKEEGYLLRIYPELQKRKHQLPKAKAYYNDGIVNPSCIMQPLVAGPTLCVTRTLVVVEDYWSALRLVAAGVRAIALSGTELNDQAIAKLLGNGIESITLVLDADARLKASKLEKENRLLFKHIGSVPLYGSDIKDMYPEEFEELVEVLK